MAHTQRAVDETAADTDDLHIGAMVGAVVADLLQAAERREVANGIGKDRFPRQRHACGGGGHILLRDTCVDELIRQLLPEGLQHAEAQISSHEFDIRIFFRQRQQRANKGVSHWAVSFCRAFSNLLHGF